LFMFFISHILKFNWQVHPLCIIDILVLGVKLLKTATKDINDA
jgi:hypothetical protein